VVSLVFDELADESVDDDEPASLAEPLLSVDAASFDPPPESLSFFFAGESVFLA
jgi:hypothetical protein